MARKETDPRNLMTQRMSLDDLDRLREASRSTAPLPGFAALKALVGVSLDDAAVRDLHLKELPSADGTTATSTALGIELAANRQRRVEAVRLHSQGHDGFHAWPGDLGGITFTSTPTLLKKLLGPPKRSHTGWDVWDSGGVAVGVVYGGPGVLVVSIMTPERAP